MPYGDNLSIEFVTSVTSYAFAPTGERKTTKIDYEKAPWKQDGYEVPSLVDSKKTDIIARKGILTQAEAEKLKTIEGTVEFYADEIDLHLTRRVSLFFEQALLCYQMKHLHFAVVGAEDQFGSSPTLKAVTPDKKNLTCQYQAAHPSSAPCLYAYDKAALNAYQAKTGPKPTPIRFLGGASYFRHNCTDDLPVKVNQTDTLLDGSGVTPDGFRTKTVEPLINRVAQGLNPIAATREFIDALEKRLISLKKSYKDDPKAPVLKKYLETIREIRGEVTNSDQMFDYLLGVKVDDESSQAARLRTICYRPRYDIIKAGQIVESRIAKRIETVLEQQLQSSTRSTESKLQFALLKSASTVRERKILERLFGKTMATLEAQYIETHKQYLVDKMGATAASAAKVGRSIQTFQTQVDSFTQENQKVVKDLLRDIRADVRLLSTEELKFRSRTLVGLFRKVYGLTGKEFVTKFKKLYPNEPMSPATLSRMGYRARPETKTEYKSPLNQRIRDISLRDAERYAKTLDVDAGHFIAGLFIDA